ncbi:hypothetical protein ILUMI_13103 [Ignelater luminosus]|uniref:DDE-1 domain-containing protein n=1 Tax=Ignelater luminosus TaxID=2038154 RepID=A0A8K0G651_IGNLU|nr:hypothetical protein ILUMI_13103 [Ignelater luminosus]
MTTKDLSPATRSGLPVGSPISGRNQHGMKEKNIKIRENKKLPTDNISNILNRTSRELIKALLNWDWSFFQSLGRSILFQESKNWMLQKRKKKFSKTVALILIDNARRYAATEEYKDLGNKGHEQVGAVTSAERGEQVTVAAVVNAQGSVMPHMILFPRKNFRNHFIRDGLRGCSGTANGSGWMNEETFVMFVHHFIKHSKPSPDNPVLLLLDNHSSHFSVEAINLCRDHGMVMLSSPPHCSHRLQPLDLPVFRPFKRQCSSGIDAWLKNNPGKTLTIYDLPKIINQAHLKAMTPANIVSGFSSARISSFNADAFDDSDFLPAIVTDRPAPGNSPNLSEEISPTEKRSANTNDQRIQENTSSVTDPQEGTSRTQFFPEASRSFPKASDRKPNCKRSQRRTTAILTRKSV